MAKYQLTENQKNILRVASAGLKDGTVESEWICARTFGRLDYVAGLGDAGTLNVSDSDLRQFERLEFLMAGDGALFYVNEQRIHDAVENDFDIPDDNASPATIQTNIYGSLYGSNLNIAQYMNHITQTVGSIPKLSEANKSEIDSLISEISDELTQFQENYPAEVRDVSRSVELVVGDLAEDVTDDINMRGSIDRLKRAGAKLIFSRLAQEGVERLVQIVESLPHAGS